uniref:Bm14266 n=1 Tax=Brugia malayi TaxID=6279 RepID=A0A1I9G4F1_BRUMA|nr:Bm14266 [Brugia malayi]
MCQTPYFHMDAVKETHQLICPSIPLIYLLGTFGLSHFPVERLTPQLTKQKAD